MVSTATKRRRRQRANRTAEAIEDSRREVEVEKQTLGVEISSNVPDEKLFSEDRKGVEKKELKAKFAKDIREEGRAFRRQRLGGNSTSSGGRKSERYANIGEMAGITYPEGALKKSKSIGNVEKTILKRRSNFSNPINQTATGKKKSNNNKTASRDIWMSDVKKEVDKNTSQSRKELVKKLTRKHRRAHAVIYPDAGMSVNPSYKDHQDKLGEALANIVAEEDRKRWDEEKLSFDPAILKEDTSKIDRVTGMKIDAGASTANINTNSTASVDDENTGKMNEEDKRKEEDDDDDDDDDVITKSNVPERKTRTERNKERRKREMQSAIKKKRRESLRDADFAKLDQIVEDAQEEADKLNGVTKRLLRKQHVPVPGRKQDRPVLVKIAGQRTRKEAHDEPVALSENLSENMRSVQVATGNPLLKDRLLSFERRGMVEPPKVIPKELWRMNQEKQLEEMRDKTKRKGKHSKSDISYWKEKSRKK